MEKTKALEKIAQEIAGCRECKKNTSGRPVPGEGDPDAKVMFIGEAPGRKEAETGRPFVGRSGKLLTHLLSEIGLNRERVYITSPVKYYPGKRAPTTEEIEHGKKHFLKQIEIIDPKLFVLLGSTAMKTLLENKYQVTKIHGQVFYESGRRYFITFHPAAAIRFPKLLPLVRRDFKSLQALIDQM